MAEPWDRRAVRSLLLALVVGAAALWFTYVRCADTDDFDSQLGWIGAATVILAAVFLAGAAFLLVARRSVGQRCRALLAMPTPSRGAVRAAALDGAGWRRVPGTARAHRDGCLLIRGKTTEVVTADGWRAGDIYPCEVCAQ